LSLNKKVTISKAFRTSFSINTLYQVTRKYVMFSLPIGNFVSLHTT